MPEAPVQRNLSQLQDPHVDKSYAPKTQKRPGTMDEWTNLATRIAGHIDALYRDARILRSKRAEAADARNGAITRAEAERNFAATLKRAADHAKELARDLLATGMSREHLQNHMELTATDHNRRPELPIALLYSKLMGIEYEEDRAVVERDEQGQDRSYVRTERKKSCWAMEVKGSEVDDMFQTLRPLSEQMPTVVSKFRSGGRH
jgi:hypothetical protein